MIYDEIIYEHKSNNNDICERLKHHYKCLKNPSLEWNMKNDKYDISLTYKDMKIICLMARDSGGNLDCFSFAHDGTTRNQTDQLALGPHGRQGTLPSGSSAVRHPGRHRE